MPEINPLTNNQIFLKKIAENTGSDYDTGDVSEINPLTIDQIFLKEIATNTAGQSGDISELEGKVADNAAAIEAMTENGCCNILPYTVQSTASATVIFTVNNGGSVTVNGTPTSSYPYITYASFTLKAGTYIVDSGVPAQSSVYVSLKDSGGNAIANTYGGKTEFTLASDTVVVAYIYLHALESVSNFTIYPMLYDARLNPTDYVPYAMTNRELTENCPRYLDLNKYSSTSLTTDYVNRHSWICPADGAYFFRSQNDSEGSHAIKLTLYAGSSNNEIFNRNSNSSEDMYVCIDSPVFYLKKDTEIQYLSDRSTGGGGGGVFVIRLN